MVSEFIDAYSDDQMYLLVLENLVNSHPVQGGAPNAIKYSSFCRLWAVMMVGGVECMIKEWAKDDSTLFDIYAYFDDASNYDRIEKLKSAFKLRGLEVNIELFEDFLAIKYIRNAYVHGEWSKTQRAFAIQRNFPSTVMNFDRSHFERMKQAYDHVMSRLGLAKAMATYLETRFANSDSN